jgi:hypothetical protein
MRLKSGSDILMPGIKFYFRKMFLANTNRNLLLKKARQSAAYPDSYFYCLTQFYNIPFLKEPSHLKSSLVDIPLTRNSPLLGAWDELQIRNNPYYRRSVAKPT